jgi:hypothetical protein
MKIIKKIALLTIVLIVFLLGTIIGMRENIKTNEVVYFVRQN